MFYDRVVVEISAGRGGNGLVAWRREPYLPKGGPWGGNGGRGGSVYLEVDPQLTSLEGLRHHRKLRAKNGIQGGPAKQQGRQGEDLIVKLPCGTLVKDAETGELLYDLTQPGDRLLLCEGGRGGRGNASFRSSRRRAPHFATEGSPGSVVKVELELKLIADVGFVGFPNAGKSTLLQAITEVPVRIGAYPFTTLRPNLGYIELEDYRRVLLADIPGVIEGAHDDRGLGFQFLRHIERTRVLVYVLDAAGYDGRDPVSDFRVLRSELEAYDPALLDRPCYVLLNKGDLEGAAEGAARFQEEIVLDPNRLFIISALEGTGVAKFIRVLSDYFLRSTENEAAEVDEAGQ